MTRKKSDHITPSTPSLDPGNSKKKLTIELMQQLAGERGGLCLSETYVNALTPLLWRCANQHQWLAPPTRIRQGHWCRQCWREGRRDTLEAMQQFAISRGGLCLSTSYVNPKSLLLWECAKKHQWSGTRNRVVKNGGWCPICADHMRLSLEEVRRAAQERGGEYLEKTYRNTNTPVRWRCARGHIWKAAGASIRAGHWCLRCANDNKRGTIEEMQAIAAAKGGSCLSTSYVDAMTKLQWRCAAGHVWPASPRRIKTQWCPACAHDNERLGIPKMQELAVQRGGRCLSEVYKRVDKPLLWQCIEGHCWEATPDSLKRGSWCRECKRIARDQKKRLDSTKKKERFSMPKLL